MGNSRGSASVEEKIPLCTLKNYPYKIEHTIQWARDAFEGLFAQSIQTLAAYRDNRGYLDSLADKPDVHDEAVRQLHELLVESPCASFDDCIRWAAKLFHKLFYTEIQQLVFQFPVEPRGWADSQRDFVDANGNKFWSGNKLYPNSIEFDETVFPRVGLERRTRCTWTSFGTRRICTRRISEFRKSRTIRICCRWSEASDSPRLCPTPVGTPRFLAPRYHQHQRGDREAGRGTAGSRGSAVGADGSRGIREGRRRKPPHRLHRRLRQSARGEVGFGGLFERSYGISQADRSTVKKISGKIIPAISTTTAFVTGLVAVEIYKLTAGMKEIESYRNCFANLSMPMLCATEPGACQKFTTGKKTFSEWDHVTLRKVGNRGED